MAIELPRASGGSVGSGGRRARSRLPDAGDVPTVRVASDPGLRVPNFAQGAGSGLEAVGTAVSEVGERLIAAEDRMRTRQEVHAESAAEDSFDAKLAELEIQFKAERDLSTLNDSAELGKMAAAARDEAMVNHSGFSGGSQLKLQTSLDRRLSKFNTRMGAVQAELSRGKTLNIIGKRLKEFGQRLRQNPGDYDSVSKEIRDLIKDKAPGLGIDEEIAQLNAGLSIAAESALNGLLDGSTREDIEEARELLNNPEVGGRLDDAARERMNTRLDDFQSAEQEGIDAGIRARAELETILGRPPTPGELEDKAGVGDSADPTATINTSATLAMGMLTKGSDPEAIKGVLTAISDASGDPAVKKAIDSIVSNLPKSQEEFQRERGEADLASRQPAIDKMVENGVPRNVATIMALGRSGANLTLPTTELTPSERTAIQADIRAAGAARRGLTVILPQLDDDTVGLWAALRDTETAGIATQIPIIREIASALGFSEEKVKKARETRALMRANVGILSRFITQKGGRLSNEDRTFALRALTILDASTEAKTAVSVVTRLIEMANEVEGENTDILRTGRAGEDSPDAQSDDSLADIVVESDGEGGFIVKGADGKVISHLTKIEE